MKNTFALTLVSFLFYSNIANAAKTCEDIGAATVKQQIVVHTSYGTMNIGEPQEFCVLRIESRQSSILASSLLSKNSNMAATAYLTGPKPVFENLGERADRAYCRQLGATYRLGHIGSGGWVNVDNPDGQMGMCVFADGSMISTWTLFYKRNDPTGAGRPNFEPHFQNTPIPYPLW